MSRKQIQELIVAWCLGIPAMIALFRIHTRFVELDMHAGGGEQNAALFPRILSWLLLLLVAGRSLGIMLPTIRGRVSEEEAVAILDKGSRTRVLQILIALSLYFFALNFIGYYVSTPIVLAVFYYILYIRKPLMLAALSVGTTLAIWFVFAVILNVVLPVGRLGLYW